MRAANLEHWNIPSRAEFVTRHARHILSRRAFIGSMGAAATVGLVPVSALAAKPSNAAPKPTDNTQTIIGTTFHFTTK